MTIAAIWTLVNNEYCRRGHNSPLREGGMLPPPTDLSIELMSPQGATAGQSVVSCGRALLWPWLATPSVYVSSKGTK